MTVLFLGLAVGMLGYKARQRRGYGPLAAGMLAAGIIVISKFYYDDGYLSYGGVFLLIAASVWNAWPRKGATGMKGIHPEPFDANKN